MFFLFIDLFGGAFQHIGKVKMTWWGDYNLRLILPFLIAYIITIYLKKNWLAWYRVRSWLICMILYEGYFDGWSWIQLKSPISKIIAWKASGEPWSYELSFPWALRGYTEFPIKLLTLFKIKQYVINYSRFCSCYTQVLFRCGHLCIACNHFIYAPGYICRLVKLQVCRHI